MELNVEEAVNTTMSGNASVQPQICLNTSNRETRNAWLVYSSSEEYNALMSEDGRQTEAEQICHDKRTQSRMLRLSTKCLDVLVATYAGGILDPQINNTDLIYFAEHLDVHLPILHTFQLSMPIFWKRVTEQLCSNKLMYQQACANSETDWKALGLSLKFGQLIENEDPDLCDEFIISEIASKICPFVKELQINQLKPSKLETSPFKQYNIPPSECHHCPLNCLAELKYLRSLSLAFGLKDVKLAYEKRFFEVSYADIEALKRGLETLQFLEEFTLHDTPIDSLQLKTLMNGLLKAPIKLLEFSNCTINNDCMKIFAFLLIEMLSIEHLELKNNRIGANGVHIFAGALSHFKGSLSYLGLRGNPLTDDGLHGLCSGIINSNQISILNIACCKLTVHSAVQLAKLIGMHAQLEALDISNVPFGHNGGEILLQYLDKNNDLQMLECRSCGLTANQEVKIRVLCERNRYYKQNRCLRPDLVTDRAAEIEADQWIKRTKHPVLVKVHADLHNKRIPAINPTSDCSPNFPPDTPHENSTDYFGSTTCDNHKFDYNLLNEEQFLEHVCVIPN